MATQWKIRLSGTGGQGVIKGAMILAEAALVDGSNATQSQVYGPESRGGSTRAEVNISDAEILFPKVECPNVLLCMSPQAYDKYIKDIEPDGVLILDGNLGEGKDHGNLTVYRTDISVLAREKAGNELAANVVALGVINGILGLVSDDAMKESLKRNFKAKIYDLNVKAYEIGLEAGRALK